MKEGSQTHALSDLEIKLSLCHNESKAPFLLSTPDHDDRKKSGLEGRDCVPNIKPTEKKRGPQSVQTSPGSSSIISLPKQSQSNEKKKKHVKAKSEPTNSRENHEPRLIVAVLSSEKKTVKEIFWIDSTGRISS